MNAIARSSPRGDSIAEESGSAAGLFLSRTVTLALVAGPPIAVAVAAPMLWGHLLGVRDLVLVFAFYVVTGFGVTVGYHRLFTHRSFRARRWFKLVLAGAGSMAVEGSPISWVANHRRHHVFSDQPGDPHSPHVHRDHVPRSSSAGSCTPTSAGSSRTTRAAVRVRVRTLVDRPRHAGSSAGCSRSSPWLLARGSVLHRAGRSRARSAVRSPRCCGPALARMALLHHVTWSVNSVCHMFGNSPRRKTDHSTNFAPLALVSFGESWHNFHHAHPASARHGALPHQIDVSAALIRVFERLGLATDVRWPTSAQVAACAAE